VKQQDKDKFGNPVQQEKPKAKDDDHVSEDEKERILRMIEDEDDSDEEEDSSNENDEGPEGKRDPNRKRGSQSSDSIVSDQDLLNRSLQSDCDEAVDSKNYFRYASEKFNAKYDLLEIVDKNERSFKQVAEKMI